MAADSLRALAATLAESPAVAPDRVVEAARQRVYDTICAATLGMRTPEGRALLRMQAPLRGIGDRILADRIPLYVGAARTTEIDDIDIASCTTVGAVVVPAALTLAATSIAGDRGSVLSAVIAGYEAMVRLGRAIGGATLLYNGVWPTYVTAAFGAAAAAAQILGLDAAATAGALAGALARASALPPRSAAAFGFRYHAVGAAALDGCLAALSANAGIVAEPDDIASYERRTGAVVEPAELTEGLGREWRILEVDTKMFPSSRQALASVEAFRKLELAPEDIEQIDRITVAVPSAYRDMIDRRALPERRIESMLGVQYSLALAAFHPEALYDALRETLPAGERVAALMGRIDVTADAELSERFPRQWASRVTVRMRSGDLVQAEVLDPSGAGRRPLGWDALRLKHERIFAASGVENPELVVEMSYPCAALGTARSPAAAELLAWPDAEADMLADAERS